MITRKEIEDKYPGIEIDELPDDLWNLLDEASFNDDWESIDYILG